MLAFLGRLSGVRAVTQRCAAVVGTRNFSSLGPALRRPSMLAFVRAMVERVQTQWQPARGQLIANDGKALTLRASLRQRCARMNHQTVGGGVVWAYMIQAARGCCPLKVLAVVRGAWHDTTLLRGVGLCARGPVYLMDRGFYCFALLEQWLAEGVHFIVRARQRSLVYQVLEQFSPPRRCGALQLELDARVVLGAGSAQGRPCVRLVIARLASGERLILASDRWSWGAERILAAYKQRWHIERFHRLLKETLGLAHLYSFAQNGLEFLLWTALLLALLLFASRAALQQACTIQVLATALRQARTMLGLGALWRRSACCASRARRKPCLNSLSTLQTFIQ
jgi:hypothetical protein